MLKNPPVGCLCPLILNLSSSLNFDCLRQAEPLSNGIDLGGIKMVIKSENQNGVALLTTLLLLMLLTGMALAMMMSVRGDLLVNGYYRNYRGAFYAADSGLNIARQQMYNQLQADIGAIPSGYTPSSGPPLTVTEYQALQSAGAVFSSWQPIAGTGQGMAAGSWPAQFEITNSQVSPQIMTVTCGALRARGTFTPATCNCGTLASPLACTKPLSGYVAQPVQAYILCSASGGGLSCPFDTHGSWPINAIAYEYYYGYSITSKGRAARAEGISLTDNGYIVVTSSNKLITSFADYGVFFNIEPQCQGDFRPGTLSGPVFTNQGWTFGTGSYTFVDSVGQAWGQAAFDFGGGNCQLSASSQDTWHGQTIKPNYLANPLALGQPPITPPDNSYSQEQAVVDSQGLAPFNQGSPGNLHDILGNPYPKSGPVPQGVYFPYTGDASAGTGALAGGGFLIKGDAGVVLTPGPNGSQNYAITQTNAGVTTTTTITVTPGAVPPNGSIQVVQQVGNAAPSTYNLANAPAIDNGDGSQSYSTMLYVDGNINSLSGPPVVCSSPPCAGGQAIQNNTNVTITAADNITITGNITYANSATGEPVTMDNADTLTAAASTAGMLGIFTAGSGCSGANCGNINMQFPTVNGNWEIDASLACLSASNTDPTSGQLVNTGNHISTLSVVGGRIQNSAGDIGADTRNVYFDRRFAGGSGPGWFPSTQNTSVTYSTQGTIQRTSWVNNSSNF